MQEMRIVCASAKRLGVGGGCSREREITIIVQILKTVKLAVSLNFCMISHCLGQMYILYIYIIVSKKCK